MNHETLHSIGVIILVAVMIVAQVKTHNHAVKRGEKPRLFDRKV